MPTLALPSTSVCDVYIGVDPGMSGGLVSLGGGEDHVSPMPDTELGVWQWLNAIPTRFKGLISDPVAMIEKVHSMPQQGVASTFKFGVSYGGLRMALIAVGIPFEEVTPQAWQKALGIPSRDKKRETHPQYKLRLLKIAQQIYPSLPLWS